MNEEYEALINAILLQAYKDLRLARHRLKKYPNDENSLHEVEKIHNFLRSDWCEFLIGFNGEWLIRQFEERINEINH